MIAFVVTLHSNIVDMAFYDFVYMLVEDCVHDMLICCGRILRTVGHHCVIVDSQRCSERMYTSHLLDTSWFDYILRSRLWKTFSQIHTWNWSWRPWLENKTHLWDKRHLDHEKQCKSGFSIFLGSGIMLANQSGCRSFVMKSESIRFLIFASIASIISWRIIVTVASLALRPNFYWGDAW